MSVAGLHIREPSAGRGDAAPDQPVLHAGPGGGGHAAHHVVLGVVAGPVLRGLPVLLDGVLHLGLPQGDGAAGHPVRQLTRGQAGHQASVVT